MPIQSPVKLMVRITLRLQAIFDLVSEWFVGLASVLLLAMAVLINVEVLGRYLLNFSTLISDEYSGYFFTWITLLCLFYALRTDRLLRVEAVLHHVGPRIRLVLELLSAIVGLFVAAILADATWSIVAVSWMFDSVSLQPSQTPLYLPQAIMPAGFALLCLGYLERLLTSALRLFGLLPRAGGRP